VIKYNAETMPSFKMLGFTRSVANVLGIYTVPGVLPCYRKVLLCYRRSVTGNRLVLGIYTVFDGDVEVLLEVAECTLTFAYIDAIPGLKYRAFVR